MKEVEIKEKTVEEKIVTLVVCNCCGKSEKGEHVDYDSSITSIEIPFGYGSRFDTEHWKMDLCDDCLENLVAGFKYPVEKREML